MVTSSEKVALQVIQQAIAALAKWPVDQVPLLQLSLDFEFLDAKEQKAVDDAKVLLGWKPETKVGILSLVFDSVNLSDEPQKQTTKHYHPLKAIDNDHKEYPDIPYPLNSEPSSEQQQAFKTEINNALSKYLKDNWENPSLLMLILEKFGSCLSFGEADVALVDIARTTAAVAVALLNNPTKKISLIAGDLSGIQNFIYTISSDGALKSLRARSFYLELITEEVLQQILAALELPRTNVIYAGGGNLYILAGDIAKINNSVNCIRDSFNRWLMNKFQGKLFLALDCLSVNSNCLNQKYFAEYWIKINQRVAIQKNQKFKKEIQSSIFWSKRISHEPCKVCHRDDLPKLKPLKNADSSPACYLCIKMFELGDKLFKIKAIVRSHKSVFNKAIQNVERFNFSGTYYLLFENLNDALVIDDAENVFLINNWELDKYQHKNTIPLLLGNYGKLTSKLDESGYIRSGEMAEKAEKLGCISRVGYLRMDVDNLGRIFADGLEEKKRNLVRISGLSRQISYFFKVYLNSLADQRDVNFIEPIQNKVTVLEKAQFLTKNQRKNLLFIYAGGDDLFISGSWNEIVEFAFDIYQGFRAYTGHHPDITISGGISINEPKFPLYQAARISGEAEDAAKANGRDSLGLFGEVFKWEEWIKIEDINQIADDQNKYKIIQSESKPEIYGILSFVKLLTEQIDFSLDYSRSFIRNLLETAETQEEMIRKNGEQKTEIRYYLHLPKLAYAFSRLPTKVHDHPHFASVRRSLLNPRNAPYFRAIATWIELLTRSRRLK